jgi:regulator of replication initiation timing
VIAGKRATNGCEGYFEDFENSSALTLVYNDTDGAAPPQIHTDTFATNDISAVMQQGRQSMQDISGVNLAGIDTTQRTAYEVMQQQLNSESNVQRLYLHAEEACHMLGHIMLGILNKGVVPEFTLEGGPAVITANMKARAEIQAVAEMVNPEHKELCAIRLAKTIDSPEAKGLEQDLKANCGLQLTEGQDVGGLINAIEKMKQQLDQATQQLQEVTQQNQELEKQNYELNMQMGNMKGQQQLDWMKFQAQMNKDEAEMAAKDVQAAKKLEQEDERLALDAMRTMGDQKRANAKLYIDTLHNNGYNRPRR